MRKNGMDMHTFSRTNILSFTKAFEQRVIKLSLDFYGSFFFLPKISFLPSSLPIHLLIQGLWKLLKSGGSKPKSGGSKTRFQPNIGYH